MLNVGNRSSIQPYVSVTHVSHIGSKLFQCSTKKAKKSHSLAALELQNVEAKSGSFCSPLAFFFLFFSFQPPGGPLPSPYSAGAGGSGNDVTYVTGGDQR